MADNRVALVKCAEYEYASVKDAIDKIFNSFGGVDKYAGKKVLIKPNLLMPRSPDEATTTHPLIVECTAQVFTRAGCTVTIADSCGGTYTRATLARLYRVCGMESAAENSSSTLNFDLSTRTVPAAENAKKLKTVNIISPAAEADVIVSVGKMKTHGLTYVSGAVKNIFGVIPGLTKPFFHTLYPDATSFSEMICDLCLTVAPSFSIIDGVVGMEGRGPSGGVPKHAGVIMGAENPFALDLAMTRAMGFNPENVPILQNALSRGLCLQALDYIAEPESDFKYTFNPPPCHIPGRVVRLLSKKRRARLERFLLPYPKIKKQCVGCGKCAESCPQKTISIIDKAAKIDYAGCIKCYCCHEMCPIRAIGFVRKLK